MDTTNNNDMTLLNIHTILARQGQILENVTQDLREVRDDVKDIRMSLKDYMPRAEAKLQFDAMQALIVALTAQMAEMQAWRMTSGTATSEKINAVKEASWTRLLSINGTILLIGAGFLLWLLEQFLVNAHIFGGK